MDLFDAVKNRRSIRKYKPQDIPKEKIDKIIEAAAWAPSAGNLQARDYIMVQDKSVKNKLCEAAHNQEFINRAPLVIVVCANTLKSGRHYGNRGMELYSNQDSAAAIQNMLLAAYSLGLSSCWVGAFDEQKVRETLSIPEHAIPVALLPIGIPDESPRPPARKPEVHKEKW
ncbi:MAG: nitroreductase family protein [Candidatus Altiarchaeota archaeon]